MQAIEAIEAHVCPCLPMPRSKWGGGVERGMKARGAGILSFVGPPGYWSCPLATCKPPPSPLRHIPHSPATESSPGGFHRLALLLVYTLRGWVQSIILQVICLVPLSPLCHLFVPAVPLMYSIMWSASPRIQADSSILHTKKRLRLFA